MNESLPLHLKNFVLFDFFISHSQLVLRCDNEDENSINKSIDIMFQGVLYLDIKAFSLDSTILRMADKDESKSMQSKIESYERRYTQVFILETNKKKYFKKRNLNHYS